MMIKFPCSTDKDYELRLEAVQGNLRVEVGKIEDEEKREYADLSPDDVKKLGLAVNLLGFSISGG